jgi:hypothetical protein
MEVSLLKPSGEKMKKTLVSIVIFITITILTLFGFGHFRVGSGNHLVVSSQPKMLNEYDRDEKPSVFWLVVITSISGYALYRFGGGKKEEPKKK